jgi:hypothetical protein
MLRNRKVAAAVLSVLVGGCGSGSTGSGTTTSAGLQRTLPGVEDIRRGLAPLNPQQLPIAQSTDTLQGPLTPANVVTVLDHGGAFGAAYAAAGRGVGAHVSFDITFRSAPWQHIDVLAIKFASGDDASSFSGQIRKVMATDGHGVVSAYITSPPVMPIIDVPPEPFGSQIGHSFVTDLVYPDGTYYLMTVAVPGTGLGTGPVAGLALRQDTEYRLCQRAPNSCGPSSTGG